MATIGQQFFVLLYNRFIESKINVRANQSYNIFAFVVCVMFDVFATLVFGSVKQLWCEGTGTVHIIGKLIN